MTVETEKLLVLKAQGDDLRSGNEVSSKVSVVFDGGFVTSHRDGYLIRTHETHGLTVVELRTDGDSCMAYYVARKRIANVTKSLILRYSVDANIAPEDGAALIDEFDSLLDPERPKRELEARERDLEAMQKAAQKAAHAKNCDVAASRFRETVERFTIPNEHFLDGIELSPLTRILEAFQGRDVIDRADVEWLESKQIFRFAAAILFRQSRAGDCWALTRASKNLRKAGLPRDALKIAKDAIQRAGLDTKFKSALHTTRGGAFRDLKEYDDASHCALEAIWLSPSSYHPYYLLGAIRVEEGKPDEAISAFAEAERLGASRKSIDGEIYRAIERAESGAQALTARALLERDPERFIWARRFIE